MTPWEAILILIKKISKTSRGTMPMNMYTKSEVKNLNGLGVMCWRNRKLRNVLNDPMGSHFESDQKNSIIVWRYYANEYVYQI